MSQSLRRLADVQDGVLSRAQVLGHGMSRHAVARLVEQQQWRALASGLYVTSNGEPPWRALAWAGVLLGGTEARLGGTSAGYLDGLIDSAPDDVTVVIPHRSRIAARGAWTFVRERPGTKAGGRSRGNPPRQPIEETVLDLCAAGPADAAVNWVTAAVQRRLCTPRRLQQALHARTRHPHRRLLIDMLGDVEAGAETPLELRYLRDVERAHSLPAGTRQVRSADRRHVRDVEYPEYLVVVELDGRVGHEGSGRFRDMWRDNVAATEGKVTLRYGWWDVLHRPCEMGPQLGQVLRMRGWPGYAQRCALCRGVPSEHWG